MTMCLFFKGILAILATLFDMLCIDKKEYEEATRYIGVASNRINASYGRINTGYLPIDALVNNAINSAEAFNIEFKTKISIEKEDINIERYDLCIALGNLLDNAVDACKKTASLDPKIIFLSIITSDRRFMIHIKNPSEYVNTYSSKTVSSEFSLHPKMDHNKRYNHSRSKVKSVSLEALAEESDDEFEIADSVDVADEVTARLKYAELMVSVNEQERQIIEMLSRNCSQQEIAEKLGISQGAVSKKIRKIKNFLTEE